VAPLMSGKVNLIQIGEKVQENACARGRRIFGEAQKLTQLLAHGRLKKGKQVRGPVPSVGLHATAAPQGGNGRAIRHSLNHSPSP